MKFFASEKHIHCNFKMPCVFIIKKNNLFLSEKDSMNIFISSVKYSIPEECKSSALYIGELNNLPVYAIEPKTFNLPNTEYVSHLVIMEIITENELQALLRATQLLNWDKNSQFCGCCGGETKISEEEFTKSCMDCDKKIYPQYSPAVLVLVRDGSRLLLSRSPHFRPGVFSVTAGFIEAGETALQAAHREVQEELNIKIKKVSAFDTASWPFPNSFMLGFIAEYESGVLKIDPKEIEEAAWFEYTELPKLPPKIGLSHRLVQEGVKLCREADINKPIKMNTTIEIRSSLMMSLFTLSGLHYLKYIHTTGGFKETMLHASVSVVAGMLYANNTFHNIFKNKMGSLDYKKVARNFLFCAPIISLAAITLNEVSGRTAFFNKIK